MATWQFDIHLIPRCKLIALYDLVPATLEEEIVETVNSWRGFLPQDYGESLARLISPSRSWSNDIQMWGEQDGNRIEVLFEAGQPEEVSIRIDARQSREQFLRELVEFACQIDALLLTENFELIEPTLEGLRTSLESSNARKFVADPHKFFESVRNGEIQIRGHRSDVDRNSIENP